MLRGSGATLEGSKPSDWFELFVDDQGDLVLLLLDVTSRADSSVDFLSTVMGETRTLLRRHAPLSTVVGSLTLELAGTSGAEVGLVIVRISQRHAQVELLNAGMPAIASAGPGGVRLFDALSGPIGRRVGEVHPYEMLPLVWGTVWLACSGGLLGESATADAVQLACDRIDLVGRGFMLANYGEEELHDVLEALFSEARSSGDDATAVIVSADPHARFESGF